MMKKVDFLSFIKHPTFIGLFSFLIILFITQYTAYHFYKLEKEKEIQKTELLALTLKSKLEAVLNSGITASKLLKRLIENEASLSEIEAVCKDIIKRNPLIDALQLVKGKSIIFTYPLKGNEATIGYKVLEDLNHLKEAIKALERKDIYFEGPIELMQGGVGVIGRIPIFKNDSLWGFSAVIIKENSFLSPLTHEDSLLQSNFSFYLSKYDSTGKEVAILPPLPPKNQKDIFYHTSIQSGNWVLTVCSNKSRYYNAAIVASIFGILLAISLSILLSYLNKKPFVLKKLVEQRTLELNQLNASLQKKTEELQKSNYSLEQFAFIASHDLQEPNRLISNFLEKLQTKYSSQLDEKANKYIHFAIQSSRRMLQIIKDLLEFSRIGDTLISKEKVDLNKLLDEFKQLNEHKIKTLSATISYSNLPTIQTNYNLLFQVFQNLIENALKYQKENSLPKIEVKVKEINNTWQISISDNGIGIDKQYFEKIFQIFQRLDSHIEYKGTGIGLAIVKKIIDGLGGKIWLESELTIGTTFYISLPKTNRL